VLLTRDALTDGEERLDLAEVHHDVLRVAALLDHARDDVALLADELTEVTVVLGVTEAREHDLLGGRGSDPTEAVGSVVVLGDLVALVVELRSEDRDVTGLAVDLHARPGLRAGGLLVGDEERLLDGLHEHAE